MCKKAKISNGVNMDMKFKWAHCKKTFVVKASRGKFLLGLVVVLLVILGALLWKARTPKASAPIKEKPILQKERKTPTQIAEPKKQEPKKPTKVVLRSSLAGKWYPADAETLGKQIEFFFLKAKVEPIKDVIALILPHAGYRFSGQTAAWGLKTTGDPILTYGEDYHTCKRVVIIGPSHYVPMEEMLTVPRATHYETPLGQVPLDLEFINKLLEYSIFLNIPQAHKQEHSVQIELPLLQHSQKDFKLVPIVAGRCSPDTIRKAARILKSLIDDDTLVIASSDFVHYGRSYGYVPFTKNVPEQIKKLDMGAYEHIARLDCNGFLKYRQRTGAKICGYVPIAILLSMLAPLEIRTEDGPVPVGDPLLTGLEKPVKADLIKYTTSGELMGDFTNSVSYFSIAFSGTWGNYPPIEPQASTHELTEEDKKQLLALARKTMVHFLQKQRVPQPSELGVTISEAMRAPRAAFVTLKKVPDPNKVPGPLKPILRGCIGDIFPRRPLYKSVIANAINAAINDRRFPPVSIAECNNITIEISALTAPEPVASPDEIRIGVDGVVLSKNGRSAIYLPQVAPEQGWDVEQMLTNLSLKAKLPKDAWKEGASFLVFQAVVFGEER
jgi:AmmeMemoRadiSam system protein B/AmmeMemoRadiSam system protein A